MAGLAALSALAVAAAGLTAAGGAQAATQPPTTTAPAATTTAPTTAPAATTRPPTTTTGTPCITFTSISHAPGQLVSNYTFEDSYLRTWRGLAGESVQISSAAARSGSFGLRATDLTPQGGAGVSLSTYSNGYYRFTVNVRSGTPGTSVPVVLRAGGVQAYATANPYTWTPLTVTFRPPIVTTYYTCPNGGTQAVTGPAVVDATLTVQQLSCGQGITTGTLDVDDATLTYLGSATTTTGAGGAGQRAACTPPTTTTTTSTTTTTRTTTTTATTTSAGVSCRVQFRVVSAWQGGYQANVAVTNLSTQPLTNWELTWTWTGSSVTQWWLGTVSSTGSSVVIRPPAWSPTLRPGETHTVGFLGSGAPATPTDVRLNGQPCSLV